MEIFKTWRAELLAELAEARIAVAEAKAELAAAMEASRVASIERDSLAESVARLAPHRVMAIALRQRLLATEEDLRRPEGRVALARGAVSNAIFRVEDLSDALRQLDTIDPLPVADSDAEAAVVDEMLVLA